MINKLIKGKFFVLICSVLIAGVFTFAGCSGDDDDDTNTGGLDTDLQNGDVLTGEYTGNVTATVAGDATITLRGLVRFGSGTTLVVNPGATIKADTNVLSYLIIDRGAKIEAIGTAAKPITFTSGRPVGARAAQDWGGIVINGYADINEGDEVAGEGDSGFYGGNNDADDSGTLKYVRIFFAGYPFSSTNELNGIALQGVGSGTEVDYVQIHNGADDGIEMFGGNVNLKHIVSSANGDDQIDCTFGWRGKIQFGIACTMNVTGADSSMEYDNNGTNRVATPVTNVTHYNMTLIGLSTLRGARMREGTQAFFYSSYFAGSGNNRMIYSEHTESSVTFDYNLFERVTAPGYVADGTNPGTLVAGANNVTTASPAVAYLDATNFATLSALQAAGAAAFEPVATATNIGVAGTTPPNDGFFDVSATFVGAVQNTANNWLTGWTEFPAN